MSSPRGAGPGPASWPGAHAQLPTPDPAFHPQHRGSSTVLTAWGAALSCGYSQNLRSTWTPAEPAGPGPCTQCPCGQWCRALGRVTSGANASGGPHLFYQFTDLTHCPRMVCGDCGRSSSQRARAKSIPFFFFLSPAKIFFLIYFIYIFLAVLGLRCCVQAFSSCGKRGILFVVVRGLLIAVASLVAERGL